MKERKLRIIETQKARAKMYVEKYLEEIKNEVDIYWSVEGLYQHKKRLRLLEQLEIEVRDDVETAYQLEHVNRLIEDWNPQHSSNPISNLQNEWDLLVYRDVKELLLDFVRMDTN